MAASGPARRIIQSSKVAFDDVTHSAHSMATQEPVKSDQTLFLCDCAIREIGAGSRD